MPQAVRPKVIIGNWKMHKLIAEARSFVSGLAVAQAQSSFHVGLAVPFTAISAAAEAARGTAIMIGAQNVSDRQEGAFTGEISCRMLKDAGASFVIAGHSERRQLFHEDDAMVNKKVLSIVQGGLKPVVCIGETFEQHKSGKTNEVLHKQIVEGLKDLSSENVERLILAYEPIWAIGTGQTSAPKDVQATHAYCREVIDKIWGKNSAGKVTLLYGGSVKPANAAELLEQNDVDGLLVGGASLSIDLFSNIIQVNFN